MVTDPKIITYKEQPYVSIRVQVTPQEFGSGIIPQLHDEVMAWLKQQGEKNSGPSIIRYRVIDMPNKLDVEMAWPVAKRLTGNERITSEVLPAGRYASLLYTGHYDGLMDANRILIEWAEKEGIKWDHWQVPEGDAFASRYENYILDPGDDPDPAKWQTEVAIKLADE
ncbi:MAG: GyrI-like domain-containing protein [Chloroflexi bacterium]|nr:GyrI-like domain-containing protein [Chloroflexota bacterium]MCC6892031.1 GyrI-like domain-containing protein [Anaerolineae bacterium]